MGRVLLLLAALILLLSADPSNSEEPGKAGPPDSPQKAIAQNVKPTEVINSYVNSAAFPDNVPDWLKRTTIQFNFREDYKPLYMIETVQPLYRFTPAGRDALFTQINASSRGDDQTYNVGLGYRIIAYGSAVLGVNAFYDYTTYYKHQRAGAGMEVLGVDYELRANGYFRTTGAEEIRSGVTEKVLSGLDAEAGGHLINWRSLKDLRLYAGYQFFNSTFTDDIKYYTLRAAYPLFRYLEVEGKMLKEENRDEKFYVQLTGSFDNPVPIRREPPARDAEAVLKRKLLQPVEREHEILIEQKNTAVGGFTVSVKRGT